MLDIAEELHRWTEEGRDFAVATVVSVGGSAPRGPGAALAVDSEGTVVGSVSGGCVEGAVYDLCVQALRDGDTVLERFGYNDEDAFAVGLTCGGVIDVMVTPVGAGSPVRTVLRAALAAAVRGEPVALARVVRGPAGLLGGALLVRPGGADGPLPEGNDEEPYEGGLGGHPELDRTAAAQARAMLDAGRTGTVEVPASGARWGSPQTESGGGSHCPGGLTLLVESNVPPPRMIVFGAVDFAAALVRAGKFLGYHVTVCDARPVFATRTRFPDADEIVIDWPHRYLRRTTTDGRTVLCVLTHDAKFDVPLLEAALRMPVAFVGAMGSRRTHEDRDRRLREAGLGEEELARLRSPIGLDLGARTPEETALSIAAEIVATRRGGTGVPLTGSGTPIHRDGTERGSAAA
ncbi:XdhC/CoxI family protein [Streptomyces sp. Li-HN-5-11]|uniref:XdhC/CoxI family protein n=1 Tax=Streptomyces sp. Li-HN-5-11 TaxID=3075432 RepID=UPI0028B0320B|nr:XdhC/CoxI family protein [Streptomyces sp. Li-HN-5-11]WNM33354.1 XdhC/CoxI family protein [Streptomyces sp. Li-HN-5-11]